MINYINNNFQANDLPKRISSLATQKNWPELNKIVSSCLQEAQEHEDTPSSDSKLKRLYTLDKVISVLTNNVANENQTLVENAVNLLTQIKSMEIKNLLNLFLGSYDLDDPKIPYQYLSDLLKKIGPEQLVEYQPEIWDLALNRQDDVLLDLLIDSKVPLSSPQLKCYPLCFAVSGGEISQIKKLLQAGADPNYPADNLPISLACNNNDLAAIKLLVDHGVNLNCKDQYGDTPLHLALNQPEFFQFLCASGADPNFFADISYSLRKNYLLMPSSQTVEKLLFSTYEDEKIYETHGAELLYLAVCAKKNALAEQLLQNHCSPNYQNLIETTLISCIRQNNLSLAQKLLEAGADPNMVPLKNASNAPIVSAIEKANSEMVSLLIKHDVNLSIVNKNNESSLLVLETRKHLMKPEKYNQIKNILVEKNHEKLEQKYKEEYFRKLAAMSSELGGISTFFSKTNLVKPLESIKLEGLFGSFWIYKQIAKSLKEFIKLPCGELLKEHAPLFIQGFQYGSKNLVEKQLEAIKNGDPCVINTGYRGHSVSILFWKGNMVICNRGGSMTDHPIKIFDINSSLITKEILEKICNTKAEDVSMYLKYILQELPKTLQAKTSEELKELEKICYLQPQKFGNCTWASSATAFYAMLILFLKDNEYDIKEIAQTSHLAYTRWLAFFQMNLLKGYLEHHISLGEKDILMKIED